MLQNFLKISFAWFFCKFLLRSFFSGQLNGVSVFVYRNTTTIKYLLYYSPMSLLNEHSPNALRSPSKQSHQGGSQTQMQCIEPPIQKGRFTVLKTRYENFRRSTIEQYKKGRFYIRDAPILKDKQEETSTVGLKEYFDILKLQNQQLDMLFDMFRNMAGQDRLFQKDFGELSSQVYEKLEALRRSFNKT